MKLLTVEGHKREALGKKDAKKLREEKLVPGVLYGNDEVVHLSVPFASLRPLIYTPNVYLIDLEVDGKTYTAMIQDVQWHPVEEEILHIDFLKIDADRPVKIAVPVKFVGMAKGAKAGGKLKVNMRKLRVKALADNLPDAIEVDITKLAIGDSIKVGQLQKENLEFLDNKSNLIVGVVSTRAAKSVTALDDDDEEGEEGASESEESSEQ
ncbi:LSU ribosomal protein L25P [Mariniphaga anaerophila]|uniref:Large ribosomal subunit protein bL25 n=1 Tax=Mariniphaga anaerophila TaxID=1484053 RepID=A0A1M5F5A3_9BACT|nr:50S ribosomal protein L25/general stress protein Ctc [Mariniphaga anaerophila]SHF86676.1 LSU ribosomal protein L25P [Mariniphaga anaerophila]